MSGKNLFRLGFMLSLGLVIFLSGAPVRARSDRVTRGDVEAALHSWNTGLRALRTIAGNIAAAPVDGFERGAIHPFLSDGKHYCSEDWHVVLAGWLIGGDQSFSYQDAADSFAGIEDIFILDEVALSTKQTPLVRRVAPSIFEEEYSFFVGSILSPSDLSVGEHTLTWLSAFPGEPLSENATIIFYVDPPGSEACE